MLRLLRFALSLACVAAFIWFAAAVPLGKHTLFGHLRALVSSPEAHDLADGVAERARETSQQLRRAWAVPIAPPASGTSTTASVAPASQPAPPRLLRSPARRGHLSSNRRPR